MITDRILGHIRIANDTIRVVECLPPMDSVSLWFTVEEVFGDPSKTQPDIRWYAYAPDKDDPAKTGVMIAYAVLERLPADEVNFRWGVAEPYRGLGLGKLMARFATDQAIRYRQRTITALIPSVNEKAIGILEAEDFDSVSALGDPSMVYLRKELKWR